MAFNPSAFGTRSYEVNCITSTGTLAPGTAVKIDALPTGLSTPALYFQFVAAGTADRPVGVVSLGGSISPTMPGRAILFAGSPLVPVLLDSSVAKGDSLCVKTSAGLWGKVAMGDTPRVVACEAGAAGDLVWASVL